LMSKSFLKKNICKILRLQIEAQHGNALVP
jgi:hypothetical protein